MKNKSSEAPEIGDRLKTVSQASNLPAVDSWLEVTKLIEMKHAAEREVRQIFYLRSSIEMKYKIFLCNSIAQISVLFVIKDSLIMLHNLNMLDHK